MILDVGSATVRRWEKGQTQPGRFREEVMIAIHEEVMRRREQQRIAQGNAERDRRQQKFVEGLLALAAGGAFGLMLGKIFSGNSNEGNDDDDYPDRIGPTS